MLRSAAPRRAALAAFLTARRARVHPSDVGLPGSGRRRTPGLRREEVAQLAEVGVSWYTWLEQGRDIHVSEAMLERVSRALRLEPAERAHLFALAQGRAPRRLTAAAAEVSAVLRAVIDAYPYPAIASTPRWDVLACNRPATLLFGDLVGRNALVASFTEPGVRARFADWEAHARGSLARFRAEAGRAADPAAFDAIVAQLTAASDDFARWWHEGAVAELPESAKRLVHPEVGEIAFDYVTLLYAEPDGRTLRVALDVPQPGESAARAARLFGGAPATAGTRRPPTPRSRSTAGRRARGRTPTA